MTELLKLRERLMVFYDEGSAYINLLLKFLLALVFFMNINSTLGFVEQINNIFVVLVLALICSLLSFFATMAVGFLLVIGHCYAVGIEVALIALILFSVLLIFYLRFAGGDSLAVILTPFSYAFNLPCAIPMGLGLLRGPTSAFASVCGTIFYYFMGVVREHAPTIQAIEKTEVAKRVQILVDALIKNQDMWLTIVASIAVVVIIYALRRLAVNYAWTIAIITGAVCYLLIMLGAGLSMNTQIAPLATLVQVLVSCGMMFVIKFFVFNVNYKRTRSLQYEDDEYHYFVKAVPKVTGEEVDRKENENG